jgi:hypothetical protein
MRVLGKLAALSIALAAVLALAAMPPHAAPRPQSEEPVPAFHSAPPSGELPSTMNPLLFPDTLVENAYIVAARIKKTLYQQPCYCHCDQSQGHGSLLDCFVSRHGAGCNVCMAEGFYAYEQSKKGKSAAAIRDGIVKGEWQKVDLNKYQSPLPGK